MTRNRATFRGRPSMTAAMNHHVPPVSGAARRSGTARAVKDRGAALVEFAFIVFPLFLILFGIIEFGWAYYQTLDVRHGAREGARLAAVNYNPNDTSGATQRDDIIDAICGRMDEDATVSVTLTLDPANADIGDEITVRVSKPLNSLTGFLDFAIPDGSPLTSSVEARLEQDATWTSGTTTC